MLFPLPDAEEHFMTKLPLQVDWGLVTGLWQMRTCRSVALDIPSISLSLQLKAESPAEESRPVLGAGRAARWKVHGSTRHRVE